MKPDKVLIVDDEPDIRTIAELSVGQVGGMNVLLAASGSEAIAMARAETPDIILLDVMMPDMDGPTTFARLREFPETQSIPVIFVTAKVQKHEVEAYREMGALGVISKPFDPMKLADQITALAADL